ncbi:MAG: hypothetical protein ACOZE5_11770 [Verrucomicrobiota bacterium]
MSTGGLYHPDGSLMLSHFIKPAYLISLLCHRAFCLTRQDIQSDPADGILPQGCFDQPHLGALELSLGLSPAFLKSQAQAVAGLRERTFVMCWTCDTAGHMRDTYGEHGARCELRTSELQLKRMLGYEWFPGAEFPPKPRAIPEIPGGRATAELKEPVYTDGTMAIPVVPSAGATAHKLAKFASEAELRIEAIVGPDGVPVSPEQDKITWSLAATTGMDIIIGSQVSEPEAAEIERLANALGMPVQRALAV